MALQLNLLHEEIAQERQRKRDPLKLGIMALGAVGALMLAFYMFKAYQTLAFKSQLSTVEQDWAKVEPKVTVAQKRAQELTNIINASDILDNIIENRFLWAPLLQTVSGCVAPNIQLTNLDGTVYEDGLVRLAVEGMAAGAEPRAAAEEFRQLLSEKLSERYKEVDVEFKTLEDLDAPVVLVGTSMPVSHYAISLSLRGQSGNLTSPKEEQARGEVKK